MCWYRSHEPITLLSVASEGGWPYLKSRAGRARPGESAVYHAIWDDGFEWDVFSSIKDFYRLDPPAAPAVPGL